MNASLRRYDPDQVRGSKTFVFLSALTSAPRAAYLIISKYKECLFLCQV